MTNLRFSAGFIKRMNAHALDLSMTMLTMFLTFLMTFGFEQRTLIRIVMFIIIFYVFCILIPLLNEGQTLGKMMMKLKPLSIKTDQPLTGIQLHIRELTKYGLFICSYGIIHLISFYMISEHKERRAIHDLLLQTYVADLSQKAEFYEVDSFAKKLGA